MSPATPTPEDALVALTLSAAAMLQGSSLLESSPTKAAALVLAASDMLDRTLPGPALKARLQGVTSQNLVAVLVDHRHEVAAVPPQLWRPAVAQANNLGAEHYAGYRAALRVLKRDMSEAQRAWEVLEAWLAPVWAAKPELREEARILWPVDVVQAQA